MDSASGEEQPHIPWNVHLWGGMIPPTLAQLEMHRTALDMFQKVAGNRPNERETGARVRRLALTVTTAATRRDGLTHLPRCFHGRQYISRCAL
jgi:hypothetical protein